MKSFTKIPSCSFLNRFLKNNAGSITTITGLAIIPIIAAAGIAIDYSRSTRVQAELQEVGDAAALAAASGQNITGSASQKISQRTAIAQNYLNAQLASLGDVTVVGSPTITVTDSSVTVGLSATVGGSLINVLNSQGQAGNTMSVSANSRAIFSKDKFLCLLATNTNQPDSVYFQGNSAFTASVCSVQSNSTATTAMRAWGSSQATAGDFCAVGGTSGTFTPAAASGCTAKPDPYSSLAMPTVGACDFNNRQVKNSTATLTPGVYCGGLDLKTHAVANLNPGLYVIKDGDLSVDSQSTLNAPLGVVIYLTGAVSNIDISSGATVTINAPRPGEGVGQAANYEGFAIIHDRATGVGNTDNISSGGAVNVSGAYYGPNANLSVVANGDMNASSAYFPIIANTFQMNGNATLHVKLDYQSAGFAEPSALKTEGKIVLTQ